MTLLRRIPALLSTLVLVGCGARTPPPAPRTPPGADRVVVFTGTCDASAAVPIDRRRFALGDDEDNVLRVYDAERGGGPRGAFDVTPALGLSGRGRAEADIEAGTRLGELALWLTSHGRRKSGKLAPDRLRLFATTLPGPMSLRPVGRPYRGLLEDLLADTRFARFGLAAAATLPPQVPGGLNVEGMTTTGEDQVLIGFRNPVPDGKALLVPIVNAREVPQGARARFGEPITLDLGGLGVRSLSTWRGRTLIVAGAIAHGRGSKLFTWTGPGAPAHAVPGLDLTGFNPEAFFTPEDRDDILVLSDDGEQLVDGEPCKSLEDPSGKSFRGVWLRLTADAVRTNPPRGG